MYLPRDVRVEPASERQPRPTRRTSISTRKLVHVAFHVSAAVASGRYDGIAIDDILAHATSRTLVDYVGRTIGVHPTFSFITPAERQGLDRQWGLFARRTTLHNFGLDGQSCGLALVVAWLVEQLAMRIPNTSCSGGA